MHKLKDYKKHKLSVSELNLLLTQIGFFNELKRKKIVFNTKPFSKQKNKKENHLDLHLDISRKIDELIAKNKEDKQINDDKKISIPRIVEPRIIEIREPSIRAPEIPVFQTDLGPNADIGGLDNIQEFFEIEPPSNFFIEKQPENKDGVENWMINQNEEEQKTNWGALKIGIRSNDPEKTSSNKNSETTIAKIELEETKKEIERKKKELEEILKKEKEKELVVKKEEEEKRRQEKLKKLELKKKIKEEKIKAKLEKITQAKKEIELKKQEEFKKQDELKKHIELKKQEMIRGEKLEEGFIEEEKITPDIDSIIDEKREFTEENISFDEDVAKLLPIIDGLFEKLPEDVIDEFTKSEYFELYEKVLLKYKNK